MISSRDQCPPRARTPSTIACPPAAAHEPHPTWQGKPRRLAASSFVGVLDTVLQPAGWEVVLGAIPTDWDDFGRNLCQLGELRTCMRLFVRVCGVGWSAGTRTMKTHEWMKSLVDTKFVTVACSGACSSPTVILNGLIWTWWNHNKSMERI